MIGDEAGVDVTRQRDGVGNISWLEHHVSPCSTRPQHGADGGDDRGELSGRSQLDGSLRADAPDADPDLGELNLSQGGAYPVRYALRLGAGFGSQISLSMLRWVETGDGARRPPGELGYAYRVADPDAWGGWLERISGHHGAELEVERLGRLRASLAGAVRAARQLGVDPDDALEVYRELLEDATREEQP